MQHSHAGVQEGGEQSWLSGGRGSFRQMLLRATLAWLEAWLPCCLCCCSTPARLRCGAFDMYVVCGGCAGEPTTILGAATWRVCSLAPVRPGHAGSVRCASGVPSLAFLRSTVRSAHILCNAAPIPAEAASLALCKDKRFNS